MLRITVELIPCGREIAKSKVCIIDVINNGTGTHEKGNYKINAQGITDEGFDIGWDEWQGFPKKLTGVDRQKGYINLAKEAMKVI